MYFGISIYFIRVGDDIYKKVRDKVSNYFLLFVFVLCFCIFIENKLIN